MQGAGLQMALCPSKDGNEAIPIYMRSETDVGYIAQATANKGSETGPLVQAIFSFDYSAGMYFSTMPLTVPSAISSSRAAFTA